MGGNRDGGMGLVIDPELRALCPPLSDEERAQLEANLLADGCRDPLAVWRPEEPDGPVVLLDGHNRYGICLKHGLTFTTVAIPLDSREAAMDWMITNQLGRRNLTPEQKSYLRGKRYNREKRQGERTDLTSGDNHQKSDTTSKALAVEYGVGRATIERDGAFAEGLDALKTIREDLPRTVGQAFIGRAPKISARPMNAWPRMGHG